MQYNRQQLARLSDNVTKINSISYNIQKMRGVYFFMDYELMMNGNVRIGQKAPDFEAETTFGKIKLEDYKGKWLVLFSHPGDFTPVWYIIGR